MMNNFEKLLVYDIYRYHVTKGQKGLFNSGIQVQVSSFEMKKGKGRIATKYRSSQGYKQLSEEQRKGLKEHRETMARKSRKLMRVKTSQRTLLLAC